MATTEEIPTEHERHSIAPEHDLIIVVKEARPRTGNDGRRFILVREFEVSTAVMREYKYFRVVLSSKQGADTGKETYEMSGDDPAALEIWLRLLHGRLDKARMDASISSVWNLVVIAQKYDFDAHCPELRQWFFAWYAENIAKHRGISNSICQKLLFPCYYFDHAPGFAAVTKHLAYNMCTHIQEEMPHGVDPMHKDLLIKNNRVIGSLNGARGSLRTRLHNRLYRPCTGLLNGKTQCKIKEKVFYQYHKALEQTGAWPFETQGYKRSISELLQLLGKFKYQDPHPGDGYSRHCVDDPKFSDVVAHSIYRVNIQFDGLCLDCMYCSINRDEDEKYWDHHEDGIWKGKCRVGHGDSTWYFSFLGRKEKMDEYQKQLRRSHA